MSFRVLIWSIALTLAIRLAVSGMIWLAMLEVQSEWLAYSLLFVLSVRITTAIFSAYIGISRAMMSKKFSDTLVDRH